jgi:hypothetical protein
MFTLLHDILDYPGNIMIMKIIESTNRHLLKNLKILLSKDSLWVTCSLEKLIIRPSKNKIENKSPPFLERIQGDTCGFISPPCGPFRYFMILIDPSIRWSHICLLVTRNIAFARLLVQIIQLRADYQIQSIQLDNVGEFTFNHLMIKIEHSVTYVYI